MDIEELAENGLHDRDFVSLTFHGHWSVGWVSIVIPFSNSRVVLDCRIRIEWPADLLVLWVAPKLNCHVCWEITNHGLRNAVLKEDIICEGARHQKPADYPYVMVGLADFAIARTAMLIKPGLGYAVEVVGEEVREFVASEPHVDPIREPTRPHI